MALQQTCTATQLHLPHGLVLLRACVGHCQVRRRQGSEGRSVTEITKLWSIYIPGPDEYHAAPSEAIARHMAEKHNAAMDGYLAKHPDQFGFGPSDESIKATVAEWRFSAEEHDREISEFDFVAWGLKEAKS